MIKAIGLRRTYGSVVAVNDVSFEIGAREIVGLLGHNGAGKTTIMKMVTGFLEPTAGSVTVNGTDVWTDRSTVQRQIGYLPENCPLYPEMQVIDYLDYAAALRGVPENNRMQRIAHVIEKTNLIKVADRSINTLSRGYKQRLGVAQAILNSPNIVILDEPTNGLDPSQIFEMRSLIKELAETATVLVSTHILQEVQAVCGRVIIINNGNLALDASMSELQATGKLRLVTDTAPATCAPILAQVPGLKVLDFVEKSGHHHYTLQPTDDADQAAALVAEKLVNNGCKIYALTPIVQDLERIFAEITAGNALPSATAATTPTSVPAAAHATVGSESPPHVPPEQADPPASATPELREAITASQKDGASNE